MCNWERRTLRGCLLPNGRVLSAVGPVDGLKDSYLSPTSFFEFDGTTLVRAADPPNSAQVPFAGRMLLLPSGEVLFAAGTADAYAYRPIGTPDDTWRPTITSAPGMVRAGSTYTLHGRQLNGLSQAVGYGDDAMAATNYPLVRLHHLAQRSGLVLPHVRPRHHGGRHWRGHPLDELLRPLRGADRRERALRGRQRHRLPVRQRERGAVPLAHPVRRRDVQPADRQPRRRAAVGARAQWPHPRRSVGPRPREAGHHRTHAGGEGPPRPRAPSGTGSTSSA